MTLNLLDQLESEASENDLILRVQVRKPLNIWTLRLVVAEKIDNYGVKILGEMKAWAYSGLSGLQLDTMAVIPSAPPALGDLIWSATMAWALECTPCRNCRLLAICDDEFKHKILVRYFEQRGFVKTRNVGSSLYDLPLRTIWGGAGSLMKADCENVGEISYRRWRKLLSKTSK